MITSPGLPKKRIDRKTNKTNTYTKVDIRSHFLFFIRSFSFFLPSFRFFSPIIPFIPPLHLLLVAPIFFHFLHSFFFTFHSFSAPLLVSYHPFICFFSSSLFTHIGAESTELFQHVRTLAEAKYLLTLLFSTTLNTASSNKSREKEFDCGVEKENTNNKEKEKEKGKISSRGIVLSALKGHDLLFSPTLSPPLPPPPSLSFSLAVPVQMTAKDSTIQKRLNAFNKTTTTAPNKHINEPLKSTHSISNSSSSSNIKTSLKNRTTLVPYKSKNTPTPVRPVSEKKSVFQIRISPKKSMKMKNAMKSSFNVTNTNNSNECSMGNNKMQARVSVSGYADINRKTNVATVAASFAKMKENMSHCLSGNNTHTTHTHAQHITSSLERKKTSEKSSFKERENSGEKTKAKSVILAGEISAKIPISNSTKVEEVDKTKKCATVILKENKSEMKGEEGEEEDENVDESFLEDEDDENDEEDDDDDEDDYSGGGENDESFYPDQEEDEEEEEEEEERGRRKKRSSQTKRANVSGRLSGEVTEQTDGGRAQNGKGNSDNVQEEESEEEEEDDNSSDDEGKDIEADEEDEEQDDEDEEEEVNRRKKTGTRPVHRQKEDREVEVEVEEDDKEERDKEEKVKQVGCIDLSISTSHGIDTTPIDVCKDSTVSQSKNICNTYHGITMSSSLFTSKPLKIKNIAPSTGPATLDNSRLENMEMKNTEIRKPLQTYTVKELQSLLKARKLTISGIVESSLTNPPLYSFLLNKSIYLSISLSINL